MARVRICIHGRRAPTPHWLTAVCAETSGAACAMFGSWAIADGEVAAHVDVAGDQLTAVLQAAALRYPDEHLILLRSDALLPTWWYARLLTALDADDVLVATPLDNIDSARSPLPEGARSDADPATIDARCHAFGRRALLDWPSFSPLLSAWHGGRLHQVDIAQIHNYTLPQTLPLLRAVLLDHLYVADPAFHLRGPAPIAPGADAVPPSPLGELREAVGAALASGVQRPIGYAGLDGKPVVLHILHGWGGGAERFVRDLAVSDDARHHLVLMARGNFHRRRYGETLELLDSSLSQPALRRLELSDPIASTSLGNRLYRVFLDQLIGDFGITAIVVSSLIGHSLDALRTNLPCVYFVHDFYPLWPILHRNLDDASVQFDDAELARDLARADAGFEFAERTPDYWHALREAFVGAALAANVQLIAPSRAALTLFLNLQPRLASLKQTVIAHGLQAWSASELPLPAPPPRARLRLLVLGRVRRGKASHMLREILPKLYEHAELFLLGAGPESAEFFGVGDVHIVLNYQRDELPDLLRRVAPDAALILPNFAETFSYTLSELASFGIPVIATRLGALAERIEDGVNGFLVAPSAADVLATVARLRNEPQALADARAALKKIPPRSLDDMAADYRDLLPLATSPRALAKPDDSDPDRITALTRASLISAARRKLDAAQATIAAQLQELHRRADWGMELDRDIRRARQNIEAAQLELNQRSAHILRLNAHVDELGAVAASSQLELHKLAKHLDTLNTQIDALSNQINNLGVQISHQQSIIAQRTASARDAVQREQAALDQYALLDQAHQQLHGELNDRTRWAQSLDSELAAMRSSTSWRITRPMRYLMRKLRGARARLAYTLRRVAGALQRTRSSIARRGIGGTLGRIGDEFRRRKVAPVAPLVVVDPPSQNFVPFALPVSATPQVSIIIPVFNKIDYTVACLQSLAEHASGSRFEVIVVDDCSQDATAERLALIDGVRSVRNEANLGFVGSCNAGAKAARGEYVLFLNNDTVVTAGWLVALLQCFAEQPDAGLVGAKLIYPDGRLQEAGGIVFSDGSGWNYGRFADPADPAYEFRREADYCSGAAIMLRRDFFDQLGGFDTRYAPAYYEDTDLAFATRAAGKKVFFEPRSQVVHFEGITAGTDVGAGMKKYQVVNKQKFLEKWKNELVYQPAPIDSARQAAAAANFRLPRRVLIIDSYTPTPDQDSGSLRMVNLMRLLRGLGYRISFLPDNHANAGKYTEALQALGVEALYHPYLSDPAAWLRSNGPSLDVVILSRHYVANNYVALVRLYAPQAKMIFDTVDLHYLREERTAAMQNRPDLARVAMSTKASELELMRESDLTLVVSEVEKAILARELPNARVEVLSNVHEIYGCRRGFAERADLLFVGGFQHPPNIDAVQWFVREISPLLAQSETTIQLHIVGSKAPQEVLDLAGPGVVVHGYVEDIAPLMDACRLSVAPLRVGAGVKGKINMAMSYGLPVVATSVAVEGMHVRSDTDLENANAVDAVTVGPDVLVADTPQEFAAAILRAYHDETLWNTLSENGLENVRAHFSFDAARAVLQSILPS